MVNLCHFPLHDAEENDTSSPKLLLTDANNGKQWASNVKDLLCNLGFNDLWISQDPGNFSLEVIKLLYSFGHAQ
jgi:hypothetical protein